MLTDQAAPGLIPSVPPKNFRGKIVDVIEVYQRRCLEESGQWLENVDQTPLILAGGKLVVPKKDSVRKM